MGFFSDLKEDISQAVNELMPEEALDVIVAEDTAAQGMLSKKQLTNEAPAAGKLSGTRDSVDLSSMLDKLEEPHIVDKPAKKAVILSDSVEEPAKAVAVKEPAMAAAPEIVQEPAIDAAPEIVQEPAIDAVPEIVQEPVIDAVPEIVQEPVIDAAPEIAEEPVMATVPEITKELELVPEIETVSEAETSEDNIISELSREEEEIMDGQVQVQTQTQISRVPVDETAVVTEGMTITGDIVSEGSMELIGTVNGNLDILGKLNITGNIQGDSKAAEIYAEGARITGEVNSQGSVKIGQSSVVIGNIAASSAVIAGAVKGNIDVHGPVILDTTAIVMGNIKSKSVQINNGAVIEGLCSQCYADVNPSSFFEEFKKKKG